MKKVLLTGASGFIGRHCLPILLAKGYEVHAIYSNNIGQSHEGVYWHNADLLDIKGSCQLIHSIEPDYLLHLAWYAVPGKFWSSSKNFSWVEASLSLLRSFAEAGGQRVVMAGSCAEYDWRYGYCVEDLTPLSPSTIYGSCKHALHQLLEVYSNAYGLSAAWGRVFFLYGAYEHPSRLVSSVIRSLINEKPAFCTHGRQIRDFLHVEDGATAFVSVLESDISGPVNIASGNPISVRDVVGKIASKIGRSDLVRLGEVPLADSEPHLIVGDTRRLTQEVGWYPRYELDSGLDITIEWWNKESKDN